MNEKKNIVVCGYPKSGTTWLSRLIAELVECPLQGNLESPEGVQEGLERISEYACYKSHHTYETLVSGELDDYYKAVYIVRDPRDVAISAAHHFRVRHFSLPGRNRLVSTLKRCGNRVAPQFLRRKRLIQAVLYGDSSISYWLGTPWRDHYGSFSRSNKLILKYEDLLDHPVQSCNKLLSYLGISKSNDSVTQAIDTQSFQNKRDRLKSHGMMSEYAFLRRGGYEYWRHELSRKENRLFIDELGPELAALSYPIV